MKNVFRSLLLTLAALSTLASCRDDSKLPAPKLAGDVPLITPVVSSDPAKQYLDFFRTRASPAQLANSTPNTRPVFEFSFDVDNSRSLKVKTVEVYKSFKRFITTTTFDLGPRVLVGAYTSFPTTISLNSQEILTDVNRIVVPNGGSSYLLPLKTTSATGPNTAVQVNDTILFTFEYVLEDGTRIILTPLNTVLVGANASSPANTKVLVLAPSTQTLKPFAIEAVIK